MRILLLCHSFNSLAQRLWVELEAAGHDVSAEFDVNERVTEEAVALWQPDLVVAPFMKRKIPDPVWRRIRCIVIHPGIRGDRGPSALDWAIQRRERTWGVTALEANGEMDAGDVWASVDFPMREATKSSLYRNEVTEAAVVALRETLAAIAGGARPRPLDRADPAVRGRWRPPMRQHDRAIDWGADDTAAIVRKVRAADGSPGVLDAVAGVEARLFGVHPEGRLGGGRPGAVIAQRDGAILRATIDGAVWMTHLALAGDGQPGFKLPAAQALGPRLAHVPEVPLAASAVVDYPTWQPVRYAEAGAVGCLHFGFYNGAMSTAQCRALLDAYRYARSRPTRVIVLAGGADFWSNGIDLNQIEAAEAPAEESWRNIVAMDDLVREIVLTDRHWTIAALQGNAGAGGVFLALAADRVAARSGVVLNPHYKSMGNLYGSEYWTYLLPRRCGGDANRARAITERRLPMGAARAAALGLVDEHFGGTPVEFLAGVLRGAQALAADPGLAERLAAKDARRRADEATKPLEAYRSEELERMKLNFFGFDPSYHVARYHFVHKVPRSRTPLYLARHRSAGSPRAAAASGRDAPAGRAAATGAGAGDPRLSTESPGAR